MSSFLSKHSANCFARPYGTMVTPPVMAHCFPLWLKSDTCPYKLTVLACNLGRLCSI